MWQKYYRQRLNPNDRFEKNIQNSQHLQGTHISNILKMPSNIEEKDQQLGGKNESRLNNHRKRNPNGF